MVCYGFVSLVLTRSYCCSSGCWDETLDKSVRERRRRSLRLSAVIKKGSVAQTFAINLRRGAIFATAL